MTDGGPCESPEGLVRGDGYCAAHGPGGGERMRTLGSLGGVAKAAKEAGAAFTAEDLPAMVTLDDAKAALDQIRVAVLTRRISHNEGSSAARAVDSWTRAHMSGAADRLVNELEASLDAKAAEIASLAAENKAQAGRIADLERQLAQRGPRVVA